MHPKAADVMANCEDPDQTAVLPLTFFQILHKHFSAWYNVVLERRLKMGKARAMSDWKLLLRAWNAWRSYVRGQKLERESRQVEQDVIETHRYFTFELYNPDDFFVRNLQTE